jgi:hypothetical protein
MNPALLPIPKLAPVVVAAALQCLKKYGTARKPSWAQPADFAVVGTIEITYEQPDTLTHTTCHVMQIWKDRKSVLRITWEGELSNSMKIWKLHKGAWVDEILHAGHLPQN